jgi:NitT/TauT family transport system ATP-binding protein
MDEPFVSLDESLAIRLRGVLASMLERHPAAVLFVTHDWREAVSLADRLVFMGGSPATVIKQVQVDLNAAERRDPRAQDRFHKSHLAAMPAIETA